MTRILPLFALILAGPSLAQAPAPEPQPLNIQQATALKCSAAFALGAAAQGRGEGSGWPPLAARGREFFVRTAAQIMDQTGRSRDLVALELSREAQALSASGSLAATMAPCLLLLDASGI